jgi:glycosyltransferase involved in cell wall biosynthesis
MITIVHLFNELSSGGAGRAMLALAKYSKRFGEFRHCAAQLRSTPISKELIDLAISNGVEVLPPGTHEELCRYLELADIVQIHWWNSPEMHEFMQRDLPMMRLVGWFHIGGHTPPHQPTEEVMNFFDMAVACSPYTLESESFQRLSRASNGTKVAMAYGPADFERVEGAQPKAHSGFNIGYIGTVHYIKMHSDFVEMSASVNIPDVNFIVCGSGGHEDDIREKAKRLGVSERFKVLGYVADVRPIISELDLYAYPLCPETYAASEVNLQEVMYSGIAVVVFPHGGIKRLVQHNQTGLVVNSAQEYKEAIEYLYHNPTERKRLGENARQYAKQHFGAENAAKVFNSLYLRLIQEPKAKRSLKFAAQPLVGSKLLVRTLGSAAALFEAALNARDDRTLLELEKQISQSNEVVVSNGIRAYAQHFSGDPDLQLWHGLTQLYAKQYAQAGASFSVAIDRGLTHWRMFWYLAQVMKGLGDSGSAEQLLARISDQIAITHGLEIG